MAKLIASAKGVDGIVSVYNDRVVIDRKGIWNFFKYGASASREIPIVALSEVIFRKATFVTVGEIEFVRSGNSSDDRRETKNVFNGMKFLKKHQPRFELIKEKVFEMINQHHQAKR